MGSLEFAGDHTFAGNADISGAGAVSFVGGTHTFNGLLLSTGPISVAATLNFGVAQSIAGPTTLSGTLGGVGDVSFTNSLTWTGGTMSGTGTTIIANGATLTLSGGVLKRLSRVIDNYGSASWTAGQVNASNGTFNNRPSGSFSAALTADNTWYGVGGMNAFNNEGTFTKTLPTTATFSPYGGATVPFNNQAGGSVNVQAGDHKISLCNLNQA